MEGGVGGWVGMLWDREGTLSEEGVRRCQTALTSIEHRADAGSGPGSTAFADASSRIPSQTPQPKKKKQCLRAR